MKIFVKIPLGVKEKEIVDTDHYTWFIDEQTKTFSLTTKLSSTQLTSLANLIAEGYTYYDTK